MSSTRDRRLFLHRLAGITLTAATPALRAGTAAPPLKMGVHPYNSTLALIATHRPLTRYLGRVLGREVEFYTAPDFDSYFDALQSGQYDLAISPPHFALVAKGYVPLLHYRQRLEPVLVVAADSNLHRVEDFRGKRIAMADRAAFIRIVMIKWLEDHGLRAGIDYTIIEKPSHGASVAAVSQGDADAGLTTLTGMRQVPADLQVRLRSVAFGLRFPHVVTIAHRRLGDAMLAQLKAELLAFPGSPEGQEFFANLGVGGYEEIDSDELRLLRPYAEYFLKRQAARSTR